MVSNSKWKKHASEVRKKSIIYAQNWKSEKFDKSAKADAKLHSKKMSLTVWQFWNGIVSFEKSILVYNFKMTNTIPTNIRV